MSQLIISPLHDFGTLMLCVPDKKHEVHVSLLITYQSLAGTLGHLIWQICRAEMAALPSPTSADNV